LNHALSKPISTELLISPDNFLLQIWPVTLTPFNATGQSPGAAYQNNLGKTTGSLILVSETLTGNVHMICTGLPVRRRSTIGQQIDETEPRR